MNRLFAFALLCVGITPFLAPRLTTTASQSSPDAKAIERSATPARRQGSAYMAGATVLQRDGSGQFHLNVAVNGQSTRFLVDTGADLVALTVEDADSLGLGLTEEDFLPIMRTAAGVGYAAPVVLDRLEIGDTEFRNVEAVVSKGLDTNLLGQSVLRRLGKVELQGDRMVLRHQ